ncbi:hypothetical protein ACOMHN_048080 [Nucella lapillus]
MALTPGSYARAAGLQSEINKVTVTRVAGSEVQFRRTIDTYQRDLRYKVNHIGHEQRLLKRSLRKYSKKLLDTKKDQKQRKSKVNEQSEKRKQQIQQFRESEQALLRSVVSPSDKPSPVEVSQLDVHEDVPDSVHGFPAGQPQNTVSALSDSPDSGVGSETEETDSPDSTDTVLRDDDPPSDKTTPYPVRKTFLTSSKRKPPYLKAKRGSTKSKRENEDNLHIQDSSDDNLMVSTQMSSTEEVLPIITEENEETVDQLKSAPEKSSSAKGDDQLPKKADNYLPDPNKSVGDSQIKTAEKTLPPLVTSLDTKSVIQTEKLCTDKGPSLPAVTKAKPNQEDNRIHEEDTSIVIKRKKPRRKTAGISYGDLIKLQHSHPSSTKQLCKLVDRLASVHGIVDPPPPPPNPLSSSLDPRNNVKIKRRSKMSRYTSDGIVKQAAVLYPMKYGYSFPDKAEDSTSAEPLKTSDDITDDQVEEMRHLHSRRKSVMKVPEIMLEHIKHPTLSDRQGSIDVTSPFYEFSEAASSLFDNLISTSVSSSSPHLSGHRNRSKPVTLTELSAQATKIRERTFQRGSSQNRTEDMDSIIVQHGNDHKQKSDVAEEDSRSRLKSRVLSPVPRKSRSLPRQRRDSVEEQLQKRLNDGGQAGKMAWQSAFGRLKMIHTLYDLSQHFAKDSQ